MRNSIQWCSEALFRVVLRLYAPSLRREFGDEIADVFRQQIADATASRGFAGFRDVWSCVIRELPVVILNAMPWQLVGGLAVSTLLTCIGFWCLVAGTGVAAIGVM
jgi:hypothetical protein